MESIVHCLSPKATNGQPISFAFESGDDSPGAVRRLRQENSELRAALRAAEKRLAKVEEERSGFFDEGIFDLANAVFQAREARDVDDSGSVESPHVRLSAACGRYFSADVTPPTTALSPGSSSRGVSVDFWEGPVSPREEPVPSSPGPCAHCANSDEAPMQVLLRQLQERDERMRQLEAELAELRSRPVPQVKAEPCQSTPSMAEADRGAEGDHGQVDNTKQSDPPADTSASMEPWQLEESW